MFLMNLELDIEDVERIIELLTPMILDHADPLLDYLKQQIKLAREEQQEVEEDE